MGGRQRQLGPEVVSDDLRVIEVRGTRVSLLVVLVNRGTAEGGLPLAGYCGGMATEGNW
jgi:hypothetical protein